MPEQTIIPYNQEAEEAALGYVITRPDEYLTLDLVPEDFYIHRHRAVWSAIDSLHKRDIDVDLITLTDELSRQGWLEQVGGPAAIAHLVAAAPLGVAAEQSAALVRENSRRRDLLQIANDLAKTAYDRQQDLSANLGAFIDRLSRLGAGEKGAVHWSRFISDLYDEVEQKAKDPTETWGIPTGFPVFDSVTGGLQPAESLILSGRPSVGKSILAMQIGQQMAQGTPHIPGFPGAIYSLEMTGKQVVRRSVSAAAQIPTRALKTGNMEDEQWPLFTQAVERLSLLPVYMADTVGWNTTALRADLARLKASKGIRWFIFDYMMLAGDVPQLDETERTTLISRNMKLICRDLDLAGILIHSMVKSTDKQPNLVALRGSGQVGYDADLICFLTEFQPMSGADKSIPKQDQDNLRTLFFAKGRELENPRKYIHLVKRPYYPAFGDYAPEPNAQRIAKPGNGRPR